MSSKPLRIAQISDLHVKPPGALAYGRVDTAKALERCVAVLNEFNPAPDFVVISGDLADTPTSEEYGYLKRLLAPLKLPFAGIPGNHDSRGLMRMAFPQADYAVASGPLNQRVEPAECRLDHDQRMVGDDDPRAPGAAQAVLDEAFGIVLTG